MVCASKFAQAKILIKIISAVSLLLILDKNQHKISLLFGKKWFFSKFEPIQFSLRKPKKWFYVLFYYKMEKMTLQKWFFFKIWAYTSFFFWQNSNFEEKICCALWWPKMKKNFAWGQLRNVPRYPKRYCIFRAIFLTVFDCFKPTVT